MYVTIVETDYDLIYFAGNTPKDIVDVVDDVTVTCLNTVYVDDDTALNLEIGRILITALYAGGIETHNVLTIDLERTLEEFAEMGYLVLNLLYVDSSLINAVQQLLHRDLDRQSNHPGD